MAKLTDRSLVLPKYALSRRPYLGEEVTYETCFRQQQVTGCEPLEGLLDVNLLSKFVNIVPEMRMEQHSETYTIDYGVDFSQKKQRMEFRVRWVEGDPVNYEIGDPGKWCHTGILVNGFCQRSVEELRSASTASSSQRRGSQKAE